MPGNKKVDVAAIEGIASRATELCVAELKEIESGLPACFRSNPGAKLPSPEVRRELNEMLDSIERSRKP